MKKYFFLAIIMIVSLNSFRFSTTNGKITKTKDFQLFLDTIGLTFTLPSGYKEIAVKENQDLWYNFAIKDFKNDFEVRYSVWSLKPTMEEYKKCKLDTNCIMINPNQIYKGRVQSNILNMTSGKGANIGPFGTQAVKKEFNADAGGSSFFEFQCEFGKGYKFGQMVYLHKDNVADVFITYLSNNRDKHPDLMMKPFHALQFKP